MFTNDGILMLLDAQVEVTAEVLRWLSVLVITMPTKGKLSLTAVPL